MGPSNRRIGATRRHARRLRWRTERRHRTTTSASVATRPIGMAVPVEFRGSRRRRLGGPGRLHSGVDAPDDGPARTRVLAIASGRNRHIEDALQVGVRRFPDARNRTSRRRGRRRRERRFDDAPAAGLPRVRGRAKGHRARVTLSAAVRYFFHAPGRSDPRVRGRAERWMLRDCVGPRCPRTRRVRRRGDLAPRRHSASARART